MLLGSTFLGGRLTFVEANFLSNISLIDIWPTGNSWTFPLFFMRTVKSNGPDWKTEPALPALLTVKLASDKLWLILPLTVIRTNAPKLADSDTPVPDNDGAVPVKRMTA